MTLYQALQYPFQGKGWFRRILILALVQLLPLVGQLILLGYGLDIVRAVYDGRSDLPPVRWASALGDGCRILLTGFIYLLPILVTIAVVGASRIGSGNGFSNLGVPAILLSIGLPLVLFLIRIVSVRRTRSSFVRQPRARGDSLRFLLNGLLPIVVTILAILLLRALVSSSGIDTGHPNGLSILLLVVFILLIFLIGIVLCLGGVRYAIENKGLLAPTNNARLLLKHRAAAGMLLLNVILLGVIAVVVISLGLVVLILPGLFMFVTCSLAFWYMFACYGMQVEVRKPVLWNEKSIVSAS